MNTSVQMLLRNHCKIAIRWVAWALVALSLSSCAYQFGYLRRSLPGGYTQLAIPVFENNTEEVGVEAYFTNAIVREFERSQVARVSDKDIAPVTLEGTITKIEYLDRVTVERIIKNRRNTLPENAVLTTEYQINMWAHVRLRRNSDQRVLWEGTFKNERVYSAPQIGTAVVNSANAIYNHSARHRNLAELADVMMEEAHDRMTENF